MRCCVFVCFYVRLHLLSGHRPIYYQSLTLPIQNGIQANSHHQIYFDVASIVRPFSFIKTFLKRK